MNGGNANEGESGQPSRRLRILQSISVAFLLVIVAGLLVVIWHQVLGEKVWVSSDTQVLMHRLPRMGQVESCYFQQGTVDGGPTYHVRGYAWVGRAAIARLTEHYPFSPVPQGSEPAFARERLPASPLTWMRSEEFSRYILPDDYAGEVLVEPAYGIVYFDYRAG